jgi:hypothetical protein
MQWASLLNSSQIEEKSSFLYVFRGLCSAWSSTKLIEYWKLGLRRR